MSKQMETVPLAEFDEQRAIVGAIWTGSRLFVAVSAFVMGGFVFAYFYLRMQDNAGDWRLNHQMPSLLIGTAVLAFVLASGIIQFFGTRRLRIGERLDWQIASAVGMLFMGIAAGLQIWELTRLPFQPASSGYTSVFVAWMPIYIAYLLGAVYWVETLVARSVRRPDTVLAIHSSGTGRVVSPIFWANVEAYSLFVNFMVLASIVEWVLIYWL